MNKAARGSLLGIEHLEAKEILSLLTLARRMNPLKPRPLLRNKRVLLLFYEPSTRTRTSFEIAAKSMGAMTTLVLSSGSSIEKGESLLDTAYTLRAVGADVMVIRHPNAGAPLLMATHLDVPVINAGDGMHEHPTQALLDAYTILRHKKTLTGLADGDRRRHLPQPRRPICNSPAQQIRRPHHPLRTARVLARRGNQPGARAAHHPHRGRSRAWRRRRLWFCGYKKNAWREPSCVCKIIFPDTS